MVLKVPCGLEGSKRLWQAVFKHWERSPDSLETVAPSILQGCWEQLWASLTTAGGAHPCAREGPVITGEGAVILGPNPSLVVTQVLFTISHKMAMGGPLSSQNRQAGGPPDATFGGRGRREG